MADETVITDNIEDIDDEEQQLYEHFRVVVAKGHDPVRIDKCFSSICNIPAETGYRRLPRPDSYT